jgi:hypothetical protein
MRRPRPASYLSRARPFSIGRSGVARLVSLVVRALVLLVSIELSGLAGVAAEMAAMNAEGSADCCSDCPLEKSGKECPPGCPNCHCSHGGAVFAPAVATELADAFDPARTVVAAPTDPAAPRAPVLPGVYRPPRFAPTFV